MPKVVFTHPVADVDQWLSKHDERVSLFAPWASEVRGYASRGGDNMVALTMDVHDMKAMQADLESPRLARAKEAHGVLEPIAMFVAPE